MRKLILLFAALAIVFANVVVACPEGYNEYDNEVTYNGCTYKYYFCLGINEFDLHEIVLTEIQVLFPCTPGDFEQYASEITDAILLDIAAKGYLYEEWGLPIPQCPDDLCTVRWRDRICYSGWIKDKINDRYVMERCNDSPTGSLPPEYFERSCGETVRICWEWENGVQVLRIWRAGFPQGEPCPPGCRDNCY